MKLKMELSHTFGWMSLSFETSNDDDDDDVIDSHTNDFELNPDSFCLESLLILGFVMFLWQ